LFLSGKVTCGIMTSLFLFQRWSNLTADGLSLPAAWMEVAAGGRIDGTGDIPFENDAFPL